MSLPHWKLMRNCDFDYEALESKQALNGIGRIALKIADVKWVRPSINGGNEDDDDENNNENFNKLKGHSLTWFFFLSVC